MNNQEAFNKVWQWFVVEVHGPSIGSGGCLYRGPNGTKCGFGVLIPDELYRESFEGNGSTWLIGYHPELGDLFRDVSPVLLDQIQSHHDDCATNTSDFGTEYAKRLERIAADFSLEIPR